MSLRDEASPPFGALASQSVNLIPSFWPALPDPGRIFADGTSAYAPTQWALLGQEKNTGRYAWALEAFLVDLWINRFKNLI